MALKGGVENLSIQSPGPQRLFDAGQATPKQETPLAPEAFVTTSNIPDLIDQEGDADRIALFMGR